MHRVVREHETMSHQTFVTKGVAPLITSRRLYRSRITIMIACTPNHGSNNFSVYLRHYPFRVISATGTSKLAIGTCDISRLVTNLVLLSMAAYADG